MNGTEQIYSKIQNMLGFPIHINTIEGMTEVPLVATEAKIAIVVSYDFYCQILSNYSNRPLIDEIQHNGTVFGYELIVEYLREPKEDIRVVIVELW